MLQAALTLALAGMSGAAFAAEASSADPSARALQLPAAYGSPLCFSGDGLRLFALAADDDALVCWELASDTEQARLAMNSRTLALVGAPRGDVVVGTEAGAFVWQPDSGLKRDFSTKEVRHLALSRTGSRLAACIGEKVVVFSLPDLKPLVSVEAYNSAMAFSPDEKWLATAEASNRVHLWDIATGAELAEVHADMGVLYGTTFSPDGRHLVAVGVGGIKRWRIELQAGNPRFTQEQVFHGPQRAVHSVAWSADGAHMVFATGSQNAIVLAGSDGRLLGMLESHSQSPALSPDGKRLVIVAVKPDTKAPFVQIWPLADAIAPARQAALVKVAIGLLLSKPLREIRGRERAQAFEQLRASPPTALELLTPALDHPQLEIRKSAITCVGLLGKDARPLIQRLQTLAKDPNVAQAASAALTMITFEKP